MTLPAPSQDRTLHIHLSLAQYPILSTHIRALMRRELFNRGVITSQAFEAEVREQAIRSQAREGMHNPFAEEAEQVWEQRLSLVRDHLTEFYFAYNLPFDIFEELVREAMTGRGATEEEMRVTFNPELAPQPMLFEQGFAIERLPANERAQLEARLQEIKVVLIKTLISDQLGYVNIAKEWFTIEDLSQIRQKKIGAGKIGGKAAGMLLAARILVEAGDNEMRAALRIPDSYFIGANLMYDFMRVNGLMSWNDQKYKSEAQIRLEYPQIRQDYMKAELPSDLLERLGALLEHLGGTPVIVRSSSLLEDNFNTSFAGKYESHFCPNQGSPEQNLADISMAIRKIYASSVNPDALLYRRAKGLQDYDERMAILIQVVQGERYGRYFLPQAAGVAFSRNLYRWSPQIRRDDGFLRLVWGLGTRAVDRVGNDYPRLVALSHPLLHPAESPKDIRRYSQHMVDLIDLEENSFKTLPAGEVLQARYTPLRYLAQIDAGGYLAPLRSMMLEGSSDALVLTFDGLLRRTRLAPIFTRMLQLLEKHYTAPVDTEFTLEIVNPAAIQPEVKISLLQCRPQSHLKEIESRIPQNLRPDDIMFSTARLAPQGRVHDIRYILFAAPEAYFALPTAAERAEIGLAIGRLNTLLAGKVFICIGPGRWGTSNPDLGIHIGYADIYNTRALVELAGGGLASAPEASFGTHFFQDLVEAEIFPLAIYLDDPDAVLNRDFFYRTPNRLEQLLPDAGDLSGCLRLIEVASYRPRHHLELVMSDSENRSVAYLAPDHS